MFSHTDRFDQKDSDMIEANHIQSRTVLSVKIPVNASISTLHKPSKVSAETSVLKFKGHKPVINDFTWTKFKHYLHTIII